MLIAVMVAGLWFWFAYCIGKMEQSVITVIWNEYCMDLLLRYANWLYAVKKRQVLKITVKV